MTDDISDLLEPQDTVLTNSDRTERFCQTYAATFSLKKASDAGGYLPQDGWKMLRRPNIAARVLELAQANGLNVNPGEVITHLKSIGFATPIDIVDPRILKAAGFNNLTPELKMAIKSFDYEIESYIETDDGERLPVLGKVKIQWFDKLKALDMLARVLELLKDSLVITDPDGQPLGTGAKLSAKEISIKLDQFAARVMKRRALEEDNDGE